ncbi:MAG: multi-sensor signal transduction histidine kinase, partial [Thermoleophilia bacterium]|nr:multi-sensor signal transduction histidine kinase [Thermoleophilia bacterium]
MRAVLSRTSFTVRLLVVASIITLGLMAVDYVTLLKLPERVARDSVNVALRENTAAFNSALADQREVLREATTPLFVRRDFQHAVRVGNVPAIQAMLTAPQLRGVQARIVETSNTINDNYGVVYIAEPFNFHTGARTVVFFRNLDTSVLDTAVTDTGNMVEFAVERDGEFIARSHGFARDIEPADVNAGVDPTVGGSLADVTTRGRDLHVFSRRLGRDSAYQLHALSTPALESNALSGTRDDVRTAVVAMTVATILGSVLIAFFAGRTVRSFASRVRELASGNYRRKLPVHGNDGFADLADSVNRLSSELDDRVTQLEETAAAFRRTLETLDDAICTWNRNGEIDYWNRGAEQLTGIARERASLDDPIVAFLAAERTPGVRRITLPVRRTGGGLTVDLVVTSMPDGGVLQTFRDTSMVDALQRTQRN